MGKIASIDDKNTEILDFNHQKSYDDEVLKDFRWFIRTHIKDKHRDSLH